MPSHLIVLIIAVPLLGAFSLPLLNKLGRKAKKIWILLVLGLTDIFSFSLYWLILEKGTFVYSVGAKLPSLTSPAGFPVRIILVADALSGFLALTFLLIASLALLYSLKALKEYSSLDKFYVLYLLLLAGILGFLFTGDFFTLFVFYEISSVAAAGLIAFFRNRESFRAAFHYLAVFAVGSLFLLFGVGILYSQYGFLNMAVIAQNLQSSFLDRVALSLIASGLLLKAGLFPFYFWKPEAYKVSPISAIVLSLISSVSAVYVLFRIIFNVFGADIALGWVLILLSVLSIFAGVFLALKENNLKRILAYLAISELGYIILGISSGVVSPNTDFGFKAIQGGLFHIVNDALDMGLLLLITGAVVYVSRTKDIFKVRGLGHKEPMLSGFFLLGILAVSGMPPLNGFASKIMIYESVFRLSPVLAMLGILGSILILAVLIKIFASVFLGASPESLRQHIDGGDENRRVASPETSLSAERVPKIIIAIIFIFAILIVLIGLFPKQFVNSFIDPAAKALISKQSYIDNIIY